MLTRLLLRIAPIGISLGLLIGYLNAQYVPPVGMAALPINWVDKSTCNPPGDVWEIDIVLGVGDPAHGIPADPVTMSGLQTALNRWDGTKWFRVRVPNTSMLNGALNNTAPDGQGVGVYMPIRTGVSKCLLLDVVAPVNPQHVNICGHGLPGYGGLRVPGCATDQPSLFTIRADSNPAAGNHIIYAPPGSNHVVLRHAELAVLPGSVPSVKGGSGNVAQAFGWYCTDCGMEYVYYHGNNPGDPGQPTSSPDVDANGVCTNWNFTGTVNTANADASHGTVTWQSNIVATKETSRRFGMPFSDGTHSKVFVGGVDYSWPQATIIINGSGYTISNHDPTTSDTVLTVNGQPGTQTNVSYSMTNPMPHWDKGCGDDLRGGQMNCDRCWMAWSYGEKIHWFANESHALSSGFSNGPVQYVGNWYECGSVCWFSGGAPVDVRGGPVADVEVRGNLFLRDPLWRYMTAGAGHSPGPPFGSGTFVSGQDPAGMYDNGPFNWETKNNVENKLGIRTLFYGNIVAGNYADAQSGSILLQNVRVCSGGPTCGIFQANGEPKTVLSDVRWESNWIWGFAQGFQMASRSLGPSNGGGISQPIQRMDYINLVLIGKDNNPWGAAGTDLFQWGGGGANTFLCDQSRTSNVAHSSCHPTMLANYTASAPLPGGDPTILDNTFDVSTVTKGVVNGTPHVVTIKLSAERHDPYVGQPATISNASGWNGTFTIAGALNGANPASSDGTFGDTFYYVDNVNSGTADGTTLCSTKAACTTAGIRVLLSTLSYKIADISLGDNVYAHDCTDSSFNAGQDASHVANAVSPTVPAGLDVYYPNTGANTLSGGKCLLEDNSGFPRNVTYQYNTSIGLDTFNIQSAGTYKQHNNNKYYHNIHVQPSSSNAPMFSCTGVTGEGGAILSKCWQQSNLEYWDNVIVGRSIGNWPTFNSPGPTNFTPATADCNIVASAGCLGWSGFMTTGSFPTTTSAFNTTTNDPTDIPFSALPYRDNFRLSMIAPAPGSSYANEGANIPAIESAFTAIIYPCPTGAFCGTHGPYPDFGAAPGGQAGHVMKGALRQKGSVVTK